MFIKCSIALLVLALVGAASGQLDSLCRGRTVDLERIPYIYQYINAAKRGSSSACSFGAKQALIDLEPILTAPNACSIETVKKITQYYEKYVSKKGQYYRDLPKQLREFFLAIGFHANRQCAHALRWNLPIVAEERISEEDNRIMRSFNDKANLLAEIVLRHNPKLQSLFIVADLSGQSITVSDTISVSPRTKVIFDEIKRTCRNKFKPVYDKLIIPQVIMENIGFEYDGGYTGEYNADFRKTQLYKDWFKIVFICESAIHQKVIVDPKTTVDQAGNKQRVTVLDKNDLAELRRETGLSFDEPEANETPQEYVLNEKLEDDVDLTSFAMKEMLETFQRKHMGAKTARQSLIRKILFEAQQVIHVDQVRFGRSSSIGRSAMEAAKDNWISGILGNVAKVFGLAISFPLAPAILASGWVTLAITMVLLAIVGEDNRRAANEYAATHNQ